MKKQKNIIKKKQKIEHDPRFEMVDFSTFHSKMTNYGCKCVKLDVIYNVSDHRCWTAIINPSQENIVVTFHMNRTDLGERMFDVQTQNDVFEDIYTDSIYDLIESLLYTKSYLNLTNN